MTFRESKLEKYNGKNNMKKSEENYGSLSHHCYSLNHPKVVQVTGINIYIDGEQIIAQEDL